MADYDVVLEHVEKTFDGDVRAVIDFNAEIAPGEFVAMLGPSGCGKTTILRMIGGLEEVTAGRIYISGKDVTDLPPALRDTAMMFQSFALFPHRTVFQNVEFSLKMKGMPKDERARRVWEMLEMDTFLDDLSDNTNADQGVQLGSSVDNSFSLDVLPALGITYSFPKVSKALISCM